MKKKKGRMLRYLVLLSVVVGAAVLSAGAANATAGVSAGVAAGAVGGTASRTSDTGAVSAVRDAERLVAQLDAVDGDGQHSSWDSAQRRAVVDAVLACGDGCNVLVFGTGRDSVVWADVNACGRTQFVETDELWTQAVQVFAAGWRSAHPPVRRCGDEDGGGGGPGRQQQGAAPSMNRTAPLDVELTVFWSLRARDGHRDFQSYHQLLDAATVRVSKSKGVRHWDVIVVDGPASYVDDSVPSSGRMQPLVTAAWLAAPHTAVFVHGTHDPVTARWAARVFGDARAEWLPTAPSRGGHPLRKYVGVHTA